MRTGTPIEGFNDDRELGTELVREALAAEFLDHGSSSSKRCTATATHFIMRHTDADRQGVPVFCTFVHNRFSAIGLSGCVLARMTVPEFKRPPKAAFQPYSGRPNGGKIRVKGPVGSGRF